MPYLPTFRAPVNCGSAIAHAHGLRRLRPCRRYELIEVPVPSMGESITEGSIQTWEKKVGEGVGPDEIVAKIETDKITVDVLAPKGGVITQLIVEEGTTVEVGQHIFTIDTEGTPSSGEGNSGSGNSGSGSSKSSDTAIPAMSEGERKDTTIPMSRMRRTIATRLKDAQNNAASLTTFQEVDMSKVMQLRKDLQSEFQKQYGVKLGFMSFFMKACSIALGEIPGVNASLEDGLKAVTYHNYADVSVAVATPTGLMVPVVKDVDKKSLGELEKDLSVLAAKARDGSITMDDMKGGTFTISNGGVFGSLSGTPILNPPQSAILGMHATMDRPVAINGKVEIRPMMQMALTYDHRIVDGREAVLFLKKIQQLIQNPESLLPTTGLSH